MANRPALRNLNGNIPPSKLKGGKEMEAKKVLFGDIFLKIMKLTDKTRNEKKGEERSDRLSFMQSTNNSRIRTDKPTSTRVTSTRTTSRPTTTAGSRTRSTTVGSSRSTASSSRSIKVPQEKTEDVYAAKYDKLEQMVRQLQEDLHKQQNMSGEARQQLEEKAQLVSILASDKERIESDVRVSRQEIEEANARRKELMETLERTKISHQVEREQLERRVRQVEGERDDLSIRLGVSESTLSGVKKDLLSTKSELEHTKAELEDVTKQLENKTRECKERKAQCESLEEQMAQMREHVSVLEAKKREHEMLRRKLHNTIQASLDAL